MQDLTPRLRLCAPAPVQQWSATSTFVTTTGGAYGARPLTINLEGIVTGSAAYTALLNKLNILERFNGQTFKTVPEDPAAPVTITILTEQQGLIDQSYRALKQSVYACPELSRRDSLVVQTRLKPYFDVNSFVLRACFGLHDRQAANEAMFEMRRVG